MSPASCEIIASRRLFYREVGGTSLSECSFGIERPKIVTTEDAVMKADGLVCTCRVFVEGLDMSPITVYGVDAVQAIQLASDLDSIVKRLTSRFEFFWLDGEPYFD